MSGVFGWSGVRLRDADAVVQAMASRMHWDGTPERQVLAGEDFTLATLGAPGTVVALDALDVKVVAQGHPRQRGRAVDATDAMQAFVDAYRRRGAQALDTLGGDFSLALLDMRTRQLLLAIDRMGVRNLAYQVLPQGIAFAGNLDALGEHPGVVHRVLPQAIYDYLYFHMVPGPGTVYERSLRLPPGHRLVASDGRAEVAPYWSMQFDESGGASQETLARDFRAALEAGVASFATREDCGTFLSGGTDSSTVTALLGRHAGTRIPSFSIGFAAEGYDEMSYARIAARAFGTDHHEYYVTQDDVASVLPWLASAYDEPFGNASAVPAYFCAKLAREAGVARMLAGDGGDELFGGNARYARQHQFELYARVPGFARTTLSALLDNEVAGRLPLLRKGRSYIAQATMPMPARYESYNLLERLGPATVLDPAFLAQIDAAEPLASLSQWWSRTSATSLINRMLALDLKFTLADNDLPKVTRACDRAGVDVAFPLLHDDVVAFSSRLPPRAKLDRTTLRPFFKQALADVLPPQIVAKQKHGFGLPAGPWLATHPALNAMMRESMASLAQRGIVRSRFIDELVGRRLAEHPGYYGTMLWILMALEGWLARVDADASRRRAAA